jgi:uncharacterized protein
MKFKETKNEKNKKPNNLINETSPYLLQHAYNPVNWYPWGNEAFSLAKKENKPIFLSIGYSTCHWCHVMEKESFEDEEIAKILNENFISIKVDREEMPAVDNVYMESAIIFTGSGGWPLTILIDHDKKPFFAGTYYSKVSLIRILKDMANTWNNDPKKLKNIANDIIKNLKKLNQGNNQRIVTGINSENLGPINYSLIDKCFNELNNRFDNNKGGFGSFPKFPSAQNLLFLNRYYFETENNKAKEMIEKTLDGMFNGGIFDHIGGGFSRYSVDRHWLVPHFEKMMYDNGMLAIAYLEAGLLFDSKYLKIAKKILDYCFREMLGTHGFYTAQDADSEGKEGKYYLFTINDIKKVLGDSDGEKFCKIFDITKDGNFDRKNIPNLIKTFYNDKEEYNKIFISESSANDEDKDKNKNYNNDFIRDNSSSDPSSNSNLNSGSSSNPSSGYNLNFNHNSASNYNDQNLNDNLKFDSFIEESTKKLYKFRSKRIPPFKDEKNLALVNGLMIATLSIGGNILNKKKYIETAENIGDFIANKLTHDGRLYTSYKDGKLRNKGVLEDYSYVIWGLIELYQVTLNEKWLNFAEEMTNNLLDLFLENGVLYFSGSDIDDLPIRSKNFYDGAIPSGNNIAICNLMKLYSITNNEKYKDVYEEIISNLENDIEKSLMGFTSLLSGFIYDKSGGLHVNLYMDLANRNSPNYNKDLEVIRDKLDFWNPFLTLSIFDRKVEDYTENKISVCENMLCKPPKNILDFSKDNINSKIIRFKSYK